jgi:hypothetical protein
MVDRMLSAVLRVVVAVTPRLFLGSLSWHVEEFVDFHANVTLGFHRNLTHPIG